MRKLKAYAFDNMVGVPNDIQSAILRVELENAGLTSLLQVPYGEPQATISGIMVFKNGQTLVLHRAWYYWSAWLIKPLPLEAALSLHAAHGKFVRPDGHCQSPRPTTSVDNYHIDTQDGLNALVAAVKAEFGEIETDVTSETFVGGMQAVNKPAANPLPAFSEHERNVAHIKKLIELARWHPDEKIRESILLQALFHAERLFPGSRKWECKVANALTSYYRDRVTKSFQQLLRPNPEAGARMWTVLSIERDQRLRAKYLNIVGHTSNAISCYAHAVTLRPQVIELLTEHAGHLRNELAGKKENEYDIGWHRVAFVEFMLGRFYRMLGKHEESRKHFAECRRIRESLSTETYKNQLIEWLKLWH